MVNSDEVINIIRTFITKNNISCPEAIYQSDRVIENAYEFIEDLCDLVGYNIVEEDID